MKSFIAFVTKPSTKARTVEKAAKVALGRIALPHNLVVAVGGDGTMLQAIRQYHDQKVVFVGISAGTLGFLQSIEPDQIDLLAKALAKKEFDLIEAPMLAVSSLINPSGGNGMDNIGELLGYGFNDIAFERRGSRPIKIKLLIDKSSGDFIGDGVVFATPLGSTAYALAAGGPIVDSQSQDIFVVAPSNPHVSSLYSSLQRPHVLDKRRMVRIDVDPAEITARPAQLVIDGNVVATYQNQAIAIYLSRHKVKLLQLEKDGFHNRIEAKRLGRY